jgi:hypothetical protein
MSDESWVDQENIRFFTDTIEMPCPRCTSEVILNRRDDIGRLGPIGRLEVTCPKCRGCFFIGGDCVNPRHELLWFESFQYKKRKRYAIAIILLSQAYEMMFAAALRHILIYRLADAIDLDTQEVNALLAQLYKTTKHFGYCDHLNCLVRLLTLRSSPRCMEEAIALIAGLPGLRKKPSVKWMTGHLGSTRAETLLARLMRSTINCVRNDVVHGNRYYPTSEEVQRLFDESEEVLPRLSHELGLSQSHWEIVY